MVRLPLETEGGLLEKSSISQAYVNAQKALGNEVPVSNGAGRYAWSPFAYVSPAFGDGATTTFVLAHNLGRQYVPAFIVNTSTLQVDTVATDAIVFTDANHITVTFGAAPAANSRVLVVGGGPSYSPNTAHNGGSAVTVGVATTVIVGANANRQYVMIQNYDPTNFVWLNVGGAAVLNQGPSINPGNDVWPRGQQVRTTLAISGISVAPVTVGVLEI